MTAVALRAAILGGVLLAALACTSPPAPTPPPAPSSPPAPASPPTVTPPPAVVEDASLLALLPAAVDGVAVTTEPQALAEAAADRDFAANVEAAAFPIVAGAADLASGVIAELRDGVFNDAFFRAWRDAYDEGACAQAGGVAGHAEVRLGGRPVFITSCAQGLTVYHAHVAEGGRDIVVSLFSLGPGRYGERLMAGITP